MRTKSILFAAALAASAIPAVAQNVYSLNVVGYVNVVLPAYEFTCIANPLNTTDNTITNLFPASKMSDGSFIQTWDPIANNFAGLSPTFNGPPLNAWSTNLKLDPGQGFFFYNGGGDNITNTFVGEVIQGASTNNLSGFGFTMVGSTEPVGGNFTNSIAGLVPSDGDFIQTWNSDLNNWEGVSPTFNGPPLNAWASPNVNIAAGQGFFYYRNDNDYKWVRTFTVQ